MSADDHTREPHPLASFLDRTDELGTTQHQVLVFRWDGRQLPGPLRGVPTSGTGCYVAMAQRLSLETAFSVNPQACGRGATPLVAIAELHAALSCEEAWS